LRRRHVLELFTGLGQQRWQGLDRDALERAEVGLGQLGVFKITQQGQTLAALALFLLAALVLLGAAAGELVQGDLAVLVGELPSGLAVEVKALLAARDGDQVGRGARVAAEKSRQGRLAELTGGALLDVDLDAQLQGLGLALEQTREELGQAGGRLGWGLACGLGGGIGHGSLIGHGVHRRGAAFGFRRRRTLRQVSGVLRGRHGRRRHGERAP